jgi:preprotein translocase subunit SecE
VALADTERSEQPKLSIFQSAAQFIREVRIELGRVTWPAWRPISPKTELWASTLVVIVAVLLLSVFVGVADVVLSRIIGLVIR